MKKLFSSVTIFSAIIVLALILRFWQLGQIPLGFHADEAAYGYNAYSLLSTGKDEYGKSFPLVLKSFGEYKPALYAYLTIPWVALFDLTSLAVRITSALFGVFSVILLYFLTKKLLENKKIGLIASFLLAISPWHLNLSRTASEVVVSIFFILLLIYALTYLKEKFTRFWLFIAIISSILALETYTASRFFIVMITALLFISSLKISGKKIKFNLKILLLCSVFIVFGMVVNFLDNAGRFNQVSITSNPATQLVLEEQIREDEFTSIFVTRIFHNKIINYGQTILRNYGEYFTFDFLFLHGGYPQRMHISESGLLYIWQLPFLLVGIYILLRKKNAITFFLLSWWVVLILPSALTFDEIPNVYRSLIVLPPIIIITAIGIWTVFSLRVLPQLLRIIFLVGLLAIGLWELAYYQHQYYKHQEVHKPWYRGYAYQPLVKNLEDLAPNYKQIVITKAHQSPYIYILFYTKYDPKKYQEEGSPRDLGTAGFGKYRFVDKDCPLSAEEEDETTSTAQTNVLYVNRGDCLMPSKNVKLIKKIYWQDKNPAFALWEYTPQN